MGCSTLMNMQSILQISLSVLEYANKALLFLISPSIKAMQDKIPINDSDYQNNAVEMADLFREEGKIYVVIAVILIIFAGVVVYLFTTEQKLKKLEKEMKEGA